ncbi:MAG: hypothetical protein RBR37_05305 [Advenella sp.]|nr:hypothetical protein [Advenella sp.]SPL81323.1 hypothetical protein [Yersinia phage fEV-1]
MKLVPEWKRCLRMFSVQAMILAGAVQGAWASLPDEMKATVSDDWLRYGTIALMVLGVIGRLVAQSSVDESR